MGGAFCARWLFIAERTSIKTLSGVVQKIIAFPTKFFLGSMMIGAVHLYHHSDGTLFPGHPGTAAFASCHRVRLLIF
jgi:hypothetical protein